MRSTHLSRFALAALTGLLGAAHAHVPVFAAEPPPAYPTRAWTGHQKWDLIVQRFPRNRPGEVAPPAGATKDGPFRMAVLVSGTQRIADALCWQVDFIIRPEGRPWGQVDNFSFLVGKRAGWPVKLIGAPPGAPSAFQPFGDAYMLTAAPQGFPAELFPLNPLEAAATASPAIMRVSRRTEGEEVVVEAEVRSGGQSELLVRQYWVEGEPWWRRYERYVHGEKDLEARRPRPSRSRRRPPLPRSRIG